MSDQSKLIWFNGEIVPWEEAQIHVMSHVLHYGSGVFEGIKCYKTDDGRAIFRLDDHIDRLLQLNGDVRDEYLTDLLFIAQKKGNKIFDFGPFGKLY